jgi:Uma2 family endonuclease
MLAVREHRGKTRLRGQPPWEIARLYPAQGSWSEDDYLELGTNHLVEFSEGFVEVLPMPTDAHQALVQCLFEVLNVFVKARKLGVVRFAALPVQLWPGKFREPDILFLRTEHDARRGEFWSGADLVMEVVSDKGRQRDLVVKRQEYAKAGIPEYWIVDQQKETITVLTLAGERYAEHGVFAKGKRATSVLLKGFEVEVKAVFEAAE